MSIINWKATGATLLPLAGGNLIGYLLRDSTKGWYDTLKTPSWKPPRIAFPIVWTSLYTGMGYASYLVWKEGGGFSGAARLPLIMYGTQLAINFSWGPIFFGMGNLGGGLATVLMLDVAAATTGYLFYTISHTAGYIFVPYVAWLSLASWRIWRVWKDNPDPITPAKWKQMKEEEVKNKFN